MTNPYQSPNDISSETVDQTIAQKPKSIRGVLWRGAKIGFFTYIIIQIITVIAILIGTVVFPGFRSHLLSDLGGASFIGIARAIGGLLAIAALGIPYGALPGALIMGIALVARRCWNKNKRK